MALVTDMRGECRAALTPATTCEPTKHAKLRVVANVPTPPPKRLTPTRPATPAAYNKLVLRDWRNATFFGSTFSGSGASTTSATFAGAGGGFASGSGRRSPSWNSQHPRTASSVSSKKKRPFGPIDNKNFDTLLAYSSEAWAGADCTMSVPKMVTPFSVTNFSPVTVPSQLPPFAAARSTSTLPRFIPAMNSFLMSLGAGRPGMSAVVMTMSHSSHCFLNSAISASRNSFDISLA
mmetsp:Transcript_59861/g.182914  ORF Transcript_59861/g.182914 Transcript_59861/m.182914 type:complete len:235 (+) Transcript_59861:1761-2465(+)